MAVTNTVSSSSEGDRGAGFTREIHNMMHAFGDSVTPLPSSVKLVESVLYKQLHCLLMKASEVSTLRGAKDIGFEDILFLMRKDRVKLNRLLNHLGIRDFQCTISKELDQNLTEIYREEKNTRKGRLRRKLCMDYLESIDQTGELTGRHQPFDTIKNERNLRAELMSQNMDENGYLEYSSARRTSFIYRGGSLNKIQTWLLSSGLFPELPKSNGLLYEILGYLAHETIAQIVDLSLLVRQDGATKPGDAFSFYLAGFTRMPGSYSVQHLAELGAKQIGCPPPITPTEIREALRRYWSLQLTPWSPFTQALPTNVNSKLLAC